jgi:hypothetical protein
VNIAGQTTSLPFNDPFAGNQLSGNWTTQSGGFGVAGNSATALSSTEPNLAVLNGVDAINVSVQANVTFTAAGQNASLLLRDSGQGTASSMYVGHVQDIGGGMLQAQIYLDFAGTETMLSGTPAFSGTGGTLTFQAEGPSLKLFLNGNLLTYAQDSTLSAGTVGLRASMGTSFSDFQAQPTNLTNAGLPFTDNFASPSLGNQLSSNWLEQVGNFNLATGAAVAQSSTTPNFATLNGLNVANVSVQANVSVAAAGDNASLVLRASGPGNSNMYLGHIGNVGNGMLQAQIFLDDNGTQTVLSAAPMFAGTGGTLTFEAVGSTLQLFLNGNLLTSVQDSTLSSGSVGFRGSAGSSFADFQAQQAP